MKAGLLCYGRVLCIACILLGLGSVGYSGQVEPLTVSEPFTSAITIQLTLTSTVQSLSASVTTTGTTTYISTSTTTKVATMGRSGPTCPYGGEYRSRICTSLCGCQYDVCVTFDYNCANDYPAVYKDRTTIQASKVRTTGTSYGVQTYTLTYHLRTTSESYKTTSTVETRHIEVTNPMQQTLGITGIGLIALGALAFLMLVWKSPREIAVAPPSRRR